MEVQGALKYPELAGSVGVDRVLWAGSRGGDREGEEEGDSGLGEPGPGVTAGGGCKVGPSVEVAINQPFVYAGAEPIVWNRGREWFVEQGGDDAFVKEQRGGLRGSTP
jgi:hypothetical protein